LGAFKRQGQLIKEAPKQEQALLVERGHAVIPGEADCPKHLLSGSNCMEHPFGWLNTRRSASRGLAEFECQSSRSDVAWGEPISRRHGRKDNRFGLAPNEHRIAVE
jgi:hypothetical protein